MLPDGAARLEELLGDFLAQGEESISDPADLARRMARLTHLIRDVIVQAFAANSASALLRGWRKGFARVLIADLDQPEKTPEFADMVAQTLAYGLFSARIMDPTCADFSRPEAQRLIPKSNPFLRDFFYQITGPALDDEPFACFVDELVALLRRTDMPLLLEGFGKRTRREDPIIHFYTPWPTSS